jgi:phage tail sheath protein FI
MTQDDIAQGNLNIMIGFAPLKPAEFIVIRIQHSVGGSRPERRSGRWNKGER